MRRMVEVTNPDRVMYPEAGLTKGDVVAHYELVAPLMLTHIEGRPLTLQRYPSGIGSKGFMQKNASAHFPDFIGRHEVPKKGGVTNHPVVHDTEGIAYLANQGTITFHAPTSTIEHPYHPDRVVFDLDPAQGDVVSARFATQAVKDFIEDLGLPGVLMTTGSKGYHVIVPSLPTTPMDAVDLMARSVAALLVRRYPDQLTTQFKIDKREGRVFLDWMRNRYTATSVAPWSLRPRAGAPVATPLAWEELSSVAPDGNTLHTTPERLASTNPWDGVDPVDLGPATAQVASMMEEAGIVLEPFDRFRS